MRKKNIPTDDGHFLITEIDSRNFKNKNLTTKRRGNKARKKYFFKKIFQNILKQTKPSNKVSRSKDIGQRNKTNKIAKNCWVSRYKRSR